MPHRCIETSQTGFQGVTHEDHKHLKVQRLYASEDRPTDKSHYLMTWFAEIHAGEPILGHFFGPAAVYIVEGEFHVQEKSKPDQITKLVAGDVLHIEEASYLTWTSPNRGKAFAASYVPSTAHPEDIVQPIEN